MEHPILPSRSPRAAVIFCFLGALLAIVVATLLRAHPQNEKWAQRYLMVGYRHGYAFVAVMVAVVFCAVVLLYDTVARRSHRLARVWTSWWTAGLLAAVSLLLCGGIMWCTNHEFGAYDQGVLVDTLWRQHLGQVAYRDFITTNPPLFVLGLRLAAWAFGVTWNAQGWLTCVFSLLTLPWTYLLLRELRLNRFRAFLLTVVAQVSGLVVLSFWWFNSTTAVVAGLFLLSCLLLLQREESRLAQASYVASFALLTWVKPNTAGLMGPLFFVLLIIGLRHRLRLLLLSAAAIALSLGALLASNIRPMSVVESYAGVARSRGLALLGFNFNPLLTAEAYFWLMCLGAVLVPLTPVLWQSLRHRNDRANAVYLLLLLLGGLIGVFAMATFGDLPDAGMGPIVLAVGVAVFGGRLQTRWTSVFYTGVFCAMLCTQVYMAGSRMRIRMIGSYFAPPAEVVHVQNPFFANMRTGPDMNSILTQLHVALAREPGPVFFSARLEWAYAATQQPSPPGLPVFYQLGTSFAPRDEAALVQRWREQRFATVFQPSALVMGRPDWGWFPVPFLDEIKAHYTPDATTYPGLIVWRRNPGV